MQISAYAKSDVGQVRDHNEDYFVSRPEIGLYIVADGMGGHAAGEVASETAATTVESIVKDRLKSLGDLSDWDSVKDKVVDVVREAVEQASRDVYLLATSDKGKAGMGTTLTMVLVVGSRGIMAHVGDSRLYLCRDASIHQLSEDHSYINEMIKRGMIKAENAEDSPYANVITRAVGIQSSVQVDTLVFDILPGDTYLICSDGLTRYFEKEQEDELGDILAGDNASGLPERLIEIANHRGGRDNVTALILRADADADADTARSTEVNLQLQTLRFISLFRHLTMKELVQTLDVFRSERYQPGDIVIREGDPGSSLYVILDGALTVSRGGNAIATLESGTHFGEMSLLNSRPRSATVTAESKTKLLQLDQLAFNELIRKEPTLGVKLLWTLAQVLSLRLDEINETLGGSPTLVDVKSPFQ